ncbi:MAG: hypothetical protein NTV63_00755 [Candidatus Woesearchaeota archaeon]|nr:hypothetical protein [Candidatus Woesearchaeota archaeon]
MIEMEEEKERTREENIERSSLCYDYFQFIHRYLAGKGLYDLIKDSSEKSYNSSSGEHISPGTFSHIIAKTIERKILGIIPYGTIEVLVGEISSEPRFATGFFPKDIPCDGFKVRVYDKKEEPAIDELMKTYESRFADKELA